MTIKQFQQMRDRGEFPVVVFNDKISDVFDYFPDPGMKARLFNCIWDEEDEAWTLYFKLNEFKDHNMAVAVPVYYDGQGNATLTWFETGKYPEDGVWKTTLFIGDEDIDMLTVVS